MSTKVKKSYRFATYTALYVTIFLTLILSVFLYFFYNLDIGLILTFMVGCYIFAFVVIQYRIEHFIHKRVKKIYDDLTLLESSSFRSQPITTDMATLTKEIDKYARDKKIEIETLKVREEYRKEFLGKVSHGLKKPLFSKQRLNLTLLDGGFPNEKVLEKYLKQANKGVERLTYIIKDLDMITKLETGDLSLDVETFDIVEVIKNVFELLEMKASKKKITLTFDLDYGSPIMVVADRDRIQQVLTNLIDNSIKYGESKGTTEVSIENLIKNKVIVRITDNGEGIQTENLSRLFERFYRVDQSGSRKKSGSGLGLSIVKHIIEAHNEKIYVESELGIGSEFSFTLEKVK